MTLCIGLTGGIGCGKSTVSDMFAKLGAGIIDTDVIAHNLTKADGAAIQAIRSTFGNEYIKNDGSLDRDKMRGLIFSDATAKRQLENILHPLILENARGKIKEFNSAPYIIIIVPLLFQSPGFQKMVQRVLLVDCAKEKQVSRVVGRSKISEAEVYSIIDQQTPRAELLKLTDDVIHNDADMDVLAEQVSVLHKRYVNSN